MHRVNQVSIISASCRGASCRQNPKGRNDGALSDLRVLDFTHYIAGPYTTKLLADYGADVLKVERPEIGDGARRLGPFPDDVPHIEKSGTFLHLNTNKRSITLNLKSPAGAGNRQAAGRGCRCRRGELSSGADGGHTGWTTPRCAPSIRRLS